MTQTPAPETKKLMMRADYGTTGAKRCAHCKQPRLIQHFADDENEPSGISKYCDRCGPEARTAITKRQEARQKARELADRTPSEGRQKAIEEFQALTTGAAAKVKSEPAPEPVSEPVPDQNKAPEPAQGEVPAVNSGIATPAAKVLIKAENLDLSKIPGRQPDLVVGVPEIEAWKLSVADAAAEAETNGLDPETEVENQEDDESATNELGAEVSD